MLEFIKKRVHKLLPQRDIRCHAQTIKGPHCCSDIKDTVNPARFEKLGLNREGWLKRFNV
jgi:hypothetical protein